MLIRSRIGDILMEQHDHLVQEIKECHEFSKQLKIAFNTAREAVELAEKGRMSMINQQKIRAVQLESLRALIQKKEEEASQQYAGIFMNFLTCLPTAPQPATEQTD